MTKKCLLALVVLGALPGLLLPGCQAAVTPLPYTAVSPATAVPPTPTDLPAPVEPAAAAAAYLAAWQAGDYATMYARLLPESQAAVSADVFARRYQRALGTATVLTTTTSLVAALEDEDAAQITFHVRWDTALLGALETDNDMQLQRLSGQWWVVWDDGLIWPGLSGGNLFYVQRQTPARANIYDRDGLGLAVEGTIVTVGVIPGRIQDEAAVLSALNYVTGMSTEEIQARYAGYPDDWFVGIADIAGETSVNYNTLLSQPGIERQEKDGRLYPGGVAPHVVGWVSHIPVESLDVYQARGYAGDEWVGISGLEAWGEEALAGEHGGTLQIIRPDGAVVVESVASSAPVRSRAIYTTLMRDFQAQVQQILGNRRGAIVVLDAQTGAVRALVSGPSFDPNLFVGPTGMAGLSALVSDPAHPLFNRAIQGTYPPASVFKVVTTASALGGGVLSADSSFYCPGYWEGLGAAARKGCWLTTGHGQITLEDGLTASCDVTFYEVGMRLEAAGQDLLPSYARGFGLGQATGLELYEENGLVPDPAWKIDTYGERWGVGDTVNISIGQGFLLVTPLQIARMIAAVGNGGTLYRPYLVDRVAAADPVYTEQVTQPAAVGTLPVSGSILSVIQDALLGVTTRTIGTAWHRFAGLSIPVAGKTGTAEAPGPTGHPHSWFAGYAPADDPEIAIAVIVEYAGEGSTVAAPMVRQVVEAYYGLPLTALPPEAQEGYVPPTPTPASSPAATP